jgi:hypothetical protein
MRAGGASVLIELGDASWLDLFIQDADLGWSWRVSRKQ